MIAWLEKRLAELESALAFVAVACLAVIGVLVTADVFFRYFLSSPIAWLYDVVSLYLVAASYSLVVSSTFAADSHMGVDFFVRLMPARMRQLFAAVADIMAILLFAAIGWVMLRRAMSDLATDNVVSGAIPWPTWPPAALLALGCLLLVLRLVIHAVKAIAGTLDAPAETEHLSS